jgi:hypothetical membrane protein
MFSETKMANVSNDLKLAEQMSALMPLAKFFFLTFLVVSVIILMCSIGLLKRKNCARILFIILMIFGIILSLGGIFFQKTPARPETSGAILMVIRIISAIVGTGMIILYSWIIKKLLSSNIKKEFMK